MDGHTQFLAPPPISSPLLQHNPSSKYTSYDSLQNPYTPQSTLDSPPFYSNSSSTRPSSTQYHAQAAEPYDPRSFTLILHMSSPCTNPFPNLCHPGSPYHPLLLLSPSRPRSMSSLALSTLPRTPMYTSPSPMQLTGRRRSCPRPLLPPRPVHDRREAVTVTGAFPVAPTPARAAHKRARHRLRLRLRQRRQRPVGRVATNLGSGPHPPNGPGRPGARRPMYAHGSSMRVYPSLPPTLWMSPTNPSLAPDLGFLRFSRSLSRRRNDSHHHHSHHHYGSSRTGYMEITNYSSSSSSLSRSLRNNPSPPRAVSPPV